MNIPHSSDERFDAIVIGGSYAGLSAALMLARARQRVLVIDAGLRRNRHALAAHGLIGQDGRAPSAIADDARATVLAYPNVRAVSASAVSAQGRIDAFDIQDDQGAHWQGRRLVLATGVHDHLPAIDGLQQRWGRHVFHCPYCHGYELDRGRIGVIAVGEISLHQAMMLPDWGRTQLLLNDSFAPDAAQRTQLSERGVQVIEGRIAAIRGDAQVALADGRTLDFDGLFVASRVSVNSALPAQLGCEFEQGPLGEFIRTDALKATSVPGVFACGDAARGAHSLAFAIGDGAQAGASAHRSLLFE